MRLFPLFLLNAALASAACVAAPEIQREIDRLPALSDSSLTLEQRMAPRRALAERYPEEYFAQLAAMPQLTYSASQDWNAFLARYRAMRDRDAGDLLEAQMLGLVSDPHASELAEAVLKRQPDTPAAHLLLLRWAAQGATSSAAERHFREYRRLCPASAAPFAYLHGIEDAALLKTSLDAAHGLLLTRSDPEAIAAWRDILDVMRINCDARLRTDALFLRSRNLYSREDWMSLMTAAYLYTKDDEARVSLRTEAAKALPPQITVGETQLTSSDMTLDPGTLTILNTSDYLYRKYSGLDRPVDICIVFSKDNPTSSHPPELCLAAGGGNIFHSRDVTLDGWVICSHTLA